MSTIPIRIALAEALRLAAQERAAGRFAEAAALLDAVREAAPASAAVQQELALLAFMQGRLAEALALARQAVAAEPERAGWWRNLCTIAERCGAYPLALEAALQATTRDPSLADHWHALAVVEYRLQRLPECIAHARAALARDPAHPGAHVLLGEARLAGGDFAGAWEDYAWRFRLAGRPPVAPVLGCPEWDGAPLRAGTLLLVADQGYGDTIQNARFLPWAAARAPAAALVAAPEIAPLLARVLPEAAVFTGWEQVAGHCAGLAAWAPLSELPRLAGIDPARIPAPASYLRADPDTAAHWRARRAALVPPSEGPPEGPPVRPREARREAPPARCVGLVWAGRPTHPNDASRSAPPAALTPLAAVPGVRLVSLQRGPTAAAAAAPGAAAWGEEIAHFGDLAGAIAALDLLISVDSAPAHLAGALGRPVWTMLPYGADWRWGMAGETTAWYPSMRLFRPAAPRDWTGVLGQVTAALADWASP